jgi:hypothetical protein
MSLSDKEFIVFGEPGDETHGSNSFPNWIVGVWKK